MKISHFQSIIFTALSIFPVTAVQAGGAPPKETAPARKSPEDANLSGNDLLKAAVTVMSGLTCYHAGGTFSAGEAKATISGDFAVGAVDLQVLGFDGKMAFRRAVKDNFYISHDSGKSWEEDGTKEMTTLLSVAVTSPLNAANKLWEQGEFKILATEKLDGEEVIHLQKAAVKGEPAMDFWIAKDAALGRVIRKGSFVIAATDGDFPVVMTYTALNKPVKIAAPATLSAPAAAKEQTKEK